MLPIGCRVCNFGLTAPPESRVCNVISLQRTLLEVMTHYNVQLSMYPDLIRFVKMKETAREALCGAVNASNEL